MHCLDCHSEGRQTPALGVCRQCGAAVCERHSKLSEQFLTCTKPVSRTMAVEPPVRRLLCTPCARAHESYAACCPQSSNTVRMS
ncbi:DUF2180 family protein [Streptomyces sp. CC219B]|uniref:DUF2180 family protein n=1 Tax=Streptomyces sp. CC219B TaxID=3044574 RepID=UPI0024A7FDC9|nr:DUF2180 family protein [Streptomyces sp. CC219B]